MSALDTVLGGIRRLDLESLLDLRPSYPPVAIELDRGEAVLVRVRSGRRGHAGLDSHGVRAIPDATVGASIFRPNLSAPDEMVTGLRALFEKTGTKPGRVSLVLPDNLAKLAIVTLPERPPNRKQLQEVLRFKLRRSVPFRLEDAAVSWQVLSGDGREVPVLVAVMLRSVVEQYETVLEAVGARPGLVDLCTPSLFNLCRPELDALTRDGSDAALLNVARAYFSLAVVRAGRLIFLRCKSASAGDEEGAALGAALGRELASSLSYYQDKLSGGGIHTILLRAAGRPYDEIAELAGRLTGAEIRPVDPSAALGLGGDARLDPETAQRIAPCVGATTGRA